MEKEIWKDIPEYEGLYQVSDLGRVRSVDRVVTDKNGRNILRSGVLLKDRIDKKTGRISVMLSKNGKVKTKRVYVLVMLAFVGERPKGHDICHDNDDVSDNKLSNLRYDTKKRNYLDVYKNGNINPRGKLSIQDVLEIRDLYNNKTHKQIELSKIYKVDKNTINNIITKKTFKWLKDDGTIEYSKTENI